MPDGISLNLAPLGPSAPEFRADNVERHVGPRVRDCRDDPWSTNPTIKEVHE